MAEQLRAAQEAYPDKPGPEGDWWLPARLGGSAPTPQEAAELDAAEAARRAARRSAPPENAAGSPAVSPCGGPGSADPIGSPSIFGKFGGYGGVAEAAVALVPVVPFEQRRDRQRRSSMPAWTSPSAAKQGPRWRW